MFTFRKNLRIFDQAKPKTSSSCGFALTEVAVGRKGYKLRIQQVLISNLIRAIIIHPHLQQSVVFLLHSYNA